MANITVGSLINDGMQYLEKNDLEGFYNNLWKRAVDEGTPAYLIGEVTEALENCDIDTIGYFAEKMYLPPFYCCNIYLDALKYCKNMVGKSTMLDGHSILELPESIRSVGHGAFAECAHLPYAVDLRNVSDVYPNAFRGTYIKEVIFGEDIAYIGLDAFSASMVHTVYFPVSFQYAVDEIDKLFGGSGLKSSNVSIEYY